MQESMNVNIERLADLEYYFSTDADSLDRESLYELIELLQKTILNERANKK